MSTPSACSVVSSLAVRQRLTRHFRNIMSPQMNLIYLYAEKQYWITTDSGAQYGPIVLSDLLPLARYLGAYRPSERSKTYAMQMPDGTIEPEGKLRHKLHMQFTTKALHNMMLMKARGAAKCVQKGLDTSNIADPVPEFDASGLYTTDVEPVYGRKGPVGSTYEGSPFTAAPGAVEVVRGNEPDTGRIYGTQSPVTPSASDVKYAEDLDPSP